MTPTEQRYAQIEKEALSIAFALERFHQYTFGRKTVIENDHKPLESIVKKPLHRAPKRLQNLLMRILNYDTEIVWRPGKDMHIADMLSRSYPEQSEPSEHTENVNMVDFLVMGDSRLEKIRQQTSADESLQILKSVIQNGWPENRQDVPTLVLPYFNVRDELSIQNGLIFRGERIVIPENLRPEMKQAVHSSHVGTDATMRRARECLYWPSMCADLRDMVQRCDICRAYDTSANAKEPLLPHETPSRPWEKVGTDLFEWEGKHYLITVCYFSNFWEIDRLYDLSSKTVIKKLKCQFARYGIPSVIVSDNGTQYVSAEFRSFMKEWDIEHYTISPRHSQANGKVESSVKSAKRLLSKCKKAKSDPYLALLELRNVPSQGIGSSPAQRLHSRRTRSFLPMSHKLLLPRGSEIINNEKEKMKSLQRKQVQDYNKRTKPLPELQEDDVVRMKPFRHGEKEWYKAKVLERLDERSYKVQTDQGIFRRNRIDLKKTQEPMTPMTPMTTDPPPPEDPVKDPAPAPATPKQVKEPVKPQTITVPATPNKQSPVKVSRSGRRIVPPQRLDM
jgi:hypothetical protein